MYDYSSRRVSYGGLGILYYTTVSQILEHSHFRTIVRYLIHFNENGVDPVPVCSQRFNIYIYDHDLAC